MTVRTIEVTQIINVSLDEDKFTQDFMEEFREHFYQFNTLEEHREHLAQLYARGFVTDFSEFIEGYGDPKDLGISFEFAHQEENSIF